MSDAWKIEKWTGMVEGETSPGCIWWHLTVRDHTGAKNGMKFEAPPDANEATLNSIASAEWKKVLEMKYPAGVS